MASQDSQESPMRRPPPAKPQAPTLTTIRDLGDDLILHIFIRLPSLPSLVRAALTCRAFLAAVRSSPTFRRRFRALHGPPLLGLFLRPDVTDVRSFAPLRRRSDRDFAAAVRASDFFLTGIPDEIACSGWYIADCRGGYILLLNWSTEQIAAYNPLTRALDRFPAPPDDLFPSRGRRAARRHLSRGAFIYHIVSSDEAPRLFRVVCLCHDESPLRAAIFSSGTREWQILPCSGHAPAQQSGDQLWLGAVAQVDGSLYWSHARHVYRLVLGTEMVQFSWIDLLDQLQGQGHTYMAGETNDGKLCIASAIEFTLYTWFRRADADGVEKWMLDNVIPLEEEVLRAAGGARNDHGALKVWAILDGVVYLTLETLRNAALPSWLLSFSLETRKLEKILNKTFHNYVYPYIMAWPPSLVGNGVNP